MFGNVEEVMIELIYNLYIKDQNLFPNGELFDHFNFTVNEHDRYYELHNKYNNNWNEQFNF